MNENGNPGGFSIQVYQKKDSDFQIITSTKMWNKIFRYV